LDCLTKWTVILILPANAKIGQPFAEYLGRSGAMWFMIWKSRRTVRIWNSVIGIAREIAALTETN